MDCRGKFPCRDCIQVFNSWSDLMYHCRKEHNPITDAILANVAGDDTYAELAPGVTRLCEETVRNYEAQIAAEKDRIQQGEVVAESRTAKCLVCDLECDPKDLNDHLQTHVKNAALDACANRELRLLELKLKKRAAQVIIRQAGDATDAAARELSRQAGDATDAAARELSRQAGDATDAAARELSRQAGDATNAAAQEISRQKGLTYIQGVTADNTKNIDQLVSEIDQMDKEESRKSGAQGGKRGAKGKKDAKSSKKPSGAEKYSKKEDKREGTSVEHCGQEDKTETAEKDGAKGGNITVGTQEDKTKAEGTSVERGGEAAEKDDITVGAQEVVEDKIKVEEKEFAENEYDVSFILLNALKKAHRRYLEDSSASNDESSRSLEKLEELASQLSSLCAGSATEDASPLILKIVKSGIDYAFTDINRYQSFLTSAVLKFASVLPRASFSEVFNYLGDQSRKTNTIEGPSNPGPCLTFGEILLQEKDLMEGDEQDEPVTLALSPSGGEAIRFPNQIGWEGEREAYRYFSTLRYKNVKWVNELQESGQPFDIVLEACDGTVEFVEVKSTALSDKEWFHISLNELKFAMEKGAAYSIAHVSKSDGGVFKLVTYQNVEKLLRTRKLKLQLHPATGR